MTRCSFCGLPREEMIDPPFLGGFHSLAQKIRLQYVGQYSYIRTVIITSWQRPRIDHSANYWPVRQWSSLWTDQMTSWLSTGWFLRELSGYGLIFHQQVAGFKTSQLRKRHISMRDACPHTVVRSVTRRSDKSVPSNRILQLVFISSHRSGVDVYMYAWPNKNTDRQSLLLTCTVRFLAT